MASQLPSGNPDPKVRSELLGFNDPRPQRVGARRLRASGVVPHGARGTSPGFKRKGSEPSFSHRLGRCGFGSLFGLVDHYPWGWAKLTPFPVWSLERGIHGFCGESNLSGKPSPPLFKVDKVWENLILGVLWGSLRLVQTRSLLCGPLSGQ